MLRGCGMVLALAGRRIDTAGQAPPRFPFAHVKTVQQKLRTLLIEKSVRTLVCSAACGADLVALDEAGKLGIDRRVFLPFNPDIFRASSVIDRPGPWGKVFDKVIAEVTASRGLAVLPASVDPRAGYIAINQLILETACELAAQTGDRAAATLVWNRHSRGADDLTAEFGSQAQQMGLPLFEIDTSRPFR